MRRTLVLLLAGGVASVASAAPSFFVSPNSYPTSSSTNDLAWQAAVGSFSEEDFDGLPTNWFLLRLSDVSTTLGGLGGESGNPQIFAGSWGGSVYGTVYGNALLSSDQTGGIHSDFVFTFDQPVTGVGAWLYDDGGNTAESMILQVTEAGGATSTSLALESSNGLDHFVEGFLGATSAAGITEARFIVIDPQTQQPVQRYFELDHFQWGLPVIPAPGTILLGAIGVGLIGFLRQRRAL